MSSDCQSQNSMLSRCSLNHIFFDSKESEETQIITCMWHTLYLEQVMRSRETCLSNAIDVTSTTLKDVATSEEDQMNISQFVDDLITKTSKTTTWNIQLFGRNPIRFWVNMTKFKGCIEINHRLICLFQYCRSCEIGIGVDFISHVIRQSNSSRMIHPSMRLR